MIQLRLFGTVAISDDEGRDLRLSLGQSKRTALLAYLAIARPRTSHRRETLLGLFWPELTEERARRALNQAVYYLRSALGNEAIFVRADEIGLSREHVDCDVIDFENAIDSGDLEHALSLYHGQLLSGFYLTDLLEFERWLETERSRLHEKAARGAFVLADRAAESGSAHDAIEWARRSMELSHDEAAVRHLIAMRDRFGDRAGAIREYDRFARQVARELEADPSPETQELIAQIRARSGTMTPFASRPALPTLDLVEQGAPIDSPGTELPATSHRDWRSRGPSATPRREISHRVLTLALVPFFVFIAWFASRAMLTTKTATANQHTVAVLPFSYTGSIDHADAAEAVVNLLDANIENAAGMHTVDWRSLKSFVDRSSEKSLTLAAASLAAQRFKADLFIVGSVAEAGDRLRVTAALYNRARGDTVDARAMAEGEPGKLFAIVDELTAKLLASRDGPATRLYRSAILTTSSLPALRAYLNGERDFREARYISAEQQFRSAVEADSSFALAYFRLSQSAELTGESSLAMWAADQALIHGRGLGRYEKQHAEAWRLTLEGKPTQAAAIYRNLINQDSTDIEALQQIAYLQYYWGPRNGHPASESGREWRRVLNFDPYNPLALVHLARIMAQSANRNDFTWIAERVSRFDAESDRVLELRALNAYVFGDSSARPRIVQDLATVTPEARRRIVVSLMTSWTDLRTVAALALKQSLDTEGTNDREGLLLSVDVARGKIREAIAATENAGESGKLYRGVIMYLYPTAETADQMKQLRDALASNPAPRDAPMARYVSGLLDLRMGDTVAARLLERQLGATREARLLRAEIARVAGDPARALELLGPVVPDGPRVPAGFQFPIAHERFLRGELLRELRRSGEALRWYSTFPDPTGYDLMYLGPVSMRIAQSYEAVGNGVAARKYYGRVADLWRDADAPLQQQRSSAAARSNAGRQPAE